MITNRSRLTFNNQTLIDQVDWYQSDLFTRQAGVTTSSLSSQLFANNVLQPWALVAGLAITDVQVAAGQLYYNEIPGSAGFYSVRFRPNAVGYWRLILTWTGGTQTVIHDFDVVGPAQTDRGLKASFIRPDC